LELALIVSTIEDALRTCLEDGIREVRCGNVEAGLRDLERANAQLNSALSELRAVHCAPVSQTR
jgi:hypothetical protein